MIPVCMGSTINIQGVANLLDDICGYFPSPDQKTCAGMNTKTNEIYRQTMILQRQNPRMYLKPLWIRSLENIL